MRRVGNQESQKDATDIDRKALLPRVARPEERPEFRPSSAAVASTAGEPLWDVDQVSAYLQIPVSSIYKMTARRAPIRIPHIRLGRRVRFVRSHVDRWLTLLTNSNHEALLKLRHNAAKVTHGHDQ